jgi:hypothetical protein
MGEVVTATCTCGYKENAAIGAGRSDFKVVCKFPHFCNSCSQVTSVDIFKSEHVCKHCGSYDVHSYESSTKVTPYKFMERFSDEILKKYGYHRKSYEYTSWYGTTKNHVLMRGKHYCPNCKCNSLQFQITMMFD